MHRRGFAIVFGILMATAAPLAAQAPVPAPTPAPLPPLAPPVPPADELTAMAQGDMAAARPLLRRVARTAESPDDRGLALRLLATYDPSTATARICSRALRVDVDVVPRRSAAECLGRLPPEVGSAHTAVLVAALDDDSLDVVTMAGWALANVGEQSALVAVTGGVNHPDVRVRRLFYGYTERMRARLGVLYEVESTAPTDEDGRTLVPPGLALVGNAHSLNVAMSTAWLGIYGGMAGWLHGALFLSAHGGRAGADAAALGGLGGAALGAALASTYAFLSADSFLLAHTVVQMGSIGLVGGFAAGAISGPPPSSGVAAANLSLLGTLIGTGVGIAMVETRPPTIGGLATGVASGVLAGAGSTALLMGYGYDPAAGVFVGALAAGLGTLAAGDSDVGLFPLASGTALGLVGLGVGAATGSFVSGGDTQAIGWSAFAGTMAGAGGGALVGLLFPSDIDPFLNGALRLDPPTLAFSPDPRTGSATPLALVGGTF